ncbi:sortase [Patescibacteria group bacterium]|nr:sortase [Patescibacteria group bacterium]
MKKQLLKYKKVLQLFAYILIGASIFFIIFFWYPQMKHFLFSQMGMIEYDTAIVDVIKQTYSDKVQSVDTASNSVYRLAIPSIGVDMKIVFDEDGNRALRKGAWHIPNSGTPDNPEGYKNIVFSGHRFLYTSGANTFYNLNKVKPGDIIFLYWQEEEYKYQVDNLNIVGPDEVSILADTGEQKLTLFTCNPVYSTKERLVVVAYPFEESN